MMQHAIALYVGGVPRPQPRPKFVRGRVISTASASVKAWQQAIRRAAVGICADTLTGPVKVDMVFHMPTRDASRWGKPHAMKPDKDNLEKLVLDQLSKARIWLDDSQAAVGMTAKLWCAPQKAGVGIQITALD